MISKKSYNIDEKLTAKIISVAYGDANFLDKIKIYQLAKKHTEVRKILEEYKSTAESLKNLGEEMFPENLLALIKSETSAKIGNEKSFIEDLFSIILFRPIASVVTVVFIVAMVVFSLSIKRPTQQMYSQAEIEQAELQAHKALSIVGQIFNQTNTTLREEILNSRVAKPIRESMGIVNTIFTNEYKTNKGDIQ